MEKNLFQFNPAEIAMYISKGKWELAKHLELINEKLIKVAKREIKRLIINMPPRHGKSELISHYFPFWYLGNNKDENVILTTYSQNFANRFGKRLRSLFREFGKTFYDMDIHKDYKGASEIKTTKGDGSIYCVGNGGSITGRGADLLIIDDPIKNQQDASSMKLRDNLWDWFQSTAYTRLEPNGAVIVVMTRWHEDDICGRILANEPDQWEVLSLPAIAESEDDPLGRKEGEALWSSKFNIDILNQKKQSNGAYFFSGLYQQNPAPLEGGSFPKSLFRYFQTNEEFYLLDCNNTISITKSKCSIFSTMDLAMSLKQTADYTVLITFAVTPDHSVLILDIIRERMESTKHIEIIKQAFAKWKPISIGIEQVQYQTALINDALNLGYPIKALKPIGDKLVRSYSISNLLSAGKIYFQQNAHWLHDFENELIHFPKGKHDDQVDAFSYICQMISPISGFEIISAGKKKSEFGDF
ncbi:MAG: phage terminase large subunit [Candidatus Kapabacteria bacterium]|nr:phage terminase large subunit [Candidatus Kapabacteria bacterium]